MRPHARRRTGRVAQFRDGVGGKTRVADKCHVEVLRSRRSPAAGAEPLIDPGRAIERRLVASREVASQLPLERVAIARQQRVAQRVLCFADRFSGGGWCGDGLRGSGLR